MNVGNSKVYGESGAQDNDWGGSWWYREIDAVNNVLRQVVAYDNGPVIGYDLKRKSDEMGCLKEIPLENLAADYDTVRSDVFNELWGTCSNRT